LDNDPEITQDDYETLARFRYALRRFLRVSEEAAAGVGLSPQQHQALLAIRGWGGEAGVTIGTLADRLQILPHSTVGLVDRLEAKGLVVRVPDVVDHRRVFIRLTGNGAAVLAKLSATNRGELSEVGPQLVTLLRKLLEGSPQDDPSGQGER
jgi:DNA-binding MarR family transcriptional regulator